MPTTLDRSANATVFAHYVTTSVATFEEVAPLSTAFTAGEQHWHARLGKLRDVVRQ